MSKKSRRRSLARQSSPRSTIVPMTPASVNGPEMTPPIPTTTTTLPWKKIAIVAVILLAGLWILKQITTPQRDVFSESEQCVNACKAASDYQACLQSCRSQVLQAIPMPEK